MTLMPSLKSGLTGVKILEPMSTPPLTANMAMDRKINLIFLGVGSQMHPYLSLFMEVTGKEETSQSIVLLLSLL